LFAILHPLFIIGQIFLSACTLHFSIIQTPKTHDDKKLRFVFFCGGNAYKRNEDKNANPLNLAKKESYL